LKLKKQDLERKCDKSTRNFEEIKWLLLDKKEKFCEKFDEEMLIRAESIGKNQFYIGKLIEIVKNITISSKNQEIHPISEKITVKNLSKTPVFLRNKVDLMKIKRNSRTFTRFVKPFASLK